MNDKHCGETYPGQPAPSWREFPVQPLYETQSINRTRLPLTDRQIAAALDYAAANGMSHLTPAQIIGLIEATLRTAP